MRYRAAFALVALVTLVACGSSGGGDAMDEAGFADFGENIGLPERGAVTFEGTVEMDLTAGGSPTRRLSTSELTGELNLRLDLATDTARGFINQFEDDVSGPLRGTLDVTEGVLERGMGDDGLSSRVTANFEGSLTGADRRRIDIGAALNGDLRGAADLGISGEVIGTYRDGTERTRLVTGTFEAIASNSR